MPKLFYEEKVFLVCIACQSMSDRSVNGSVTGVTKSIKTTTKNAKSQHHMKSMKFWKKKSLIHEQQQSSIRLSSSDNIDMDLPPSVEESFNNTHPKPELPGYMLNSLSELKDHGFDSDSNAPAFYWSRHQLPGSGVRNLTANAFSLPTQQVTNEEARFLLTISSLLIQLTESQRELFTECMLQAANSKHPELHSCKVDGYYQENHLPSCKACRKQHLQRIILGSGDQDQSNQQGLLLGSDSTLNNDTQSHVSQPCNGRKCSSWDVLHPSFTFCAPTNFPINYDQ